MPQTDELEKFEREQRAIYERRGMRVLRDDSLPHHIFSRIDEFPRGANVSTAELRRALKSTYLSDMPSSQQITNALSSLVKRGYLERYGRNYAIKGERSDELESAVLASEASESFCRTLVSMVVDTFEFKKDKSIPAYNYDRNGHCLESSSGNPPAGIHLMVIDGKPRHLMLATYAKGPDRIIEEAFSALHIRFDNGDGGVYFMDYFKECTKVNERYRNYFNVCKDQKLIREMDSGHLAFSLRCDWFRWADEQTKLWFSTEVKRAANVSQEL